MRSLFMLLSILSVAALAHGQDAASRIKLDIESVPGKSVRLTPSTLSLFLEDRVQISMQQLRWDIEKLSMQIDILTTERDGILAIQQDIEQRMASLRGMNIEVHSIEQLNEYVRKSGQASLDYSAVRREISAVEELIEEKQKVDQNAPGYADMQEAIRMQEHLVEMAQALVDSGQRREIDLFKERRDLALLRRDATRTNSALVDALQQRLIELIPRSSTLEERARVMSLRVNDLEEKREVLRRLQVNQRNLEVKARRLERITSEIADLQLHSKWLNRILMRYESAQADVEAAKTDTP